MARTEVQARVLQEIRDSDCHPVLTTTEQIRASLGFTEQRAREVLGELKSAGRVRTVGERKGWMAVTPQRNPALLEPIRAGLC